MQAEREVRRREKSEGFDKGVGDGLVAGEVGVKLVARVRVSVRVICLRRCKRRQRAKHHKGSSGIGFR